jgi:hypothetical protein
VGFLVSHDKLNIVFYQIFLASIFFISIISGWWNQCYVAGMTILTWNIELVLSMEKLLHIVAFIKYVDIMIGNKFATKPSSKWFLG